MMPALRLLLPDVLRAARRFTPWVVLSLLVVPNGKGIAQTVDENRNSGTSEAVSSVGEREPDDPQPLVLEPFAPRPLTAADYPPSNPLFGLSVRGTSAIFGRDWRAGRAEYRGVVERESLAFGLPPALVDAVMAVESGYNSGVIGRDGEVGLMQVMLPTARMLGFTGSPAELAIPEVNVHYGAKYLAGAWRRAGGDLCTAAMKYRAGHGETRFSFLSVEYCMRVRAHLAANGVSVAGSVPQPTFGNPAGTGRSRVLAPAANGTTDFAALNSRMRSLVERKMQPELR
jgi:hypothetical protein